MNNYSSCYPHSIPVFTKNTHHSAPDDITERYATQKVSVEKALELREFYWAKYQVAKDKAEEDDSIKQLKKQKTEFIDNRPLGSTYQNVELQEIFKTYYTNLRNLETKISRQLEIIDPDIPNLRADYSHQVDESRKEYNSLERLRSAIRLLYPIIKPPSEKTENELLQCTICVENKKDRALPCGHLYCSECVKKCKNECPNCKKSFETKKVIRVYID
jgi:hypothetical protein